MKYLQSSLVVSDKQVNRLGLDKNLHGNILKCCGEDKNYFQTI